MQRYNNNPDNRCWACGEIIHNPQYWVSERIRDWGVLTQDYIRNPIHKTCYNTLGPDTTRFFINGLEPTILRQQAG